MIMFNHKERECPMGGYVTQTRKLGKQADRSNAVLAGLPRSGQFDRLTTQVTYSYRDTQAEITPLQHLYNVKEEANKRIFRPHDNGHTFETTKQWSNASWFNIDGTGPNWLNGNLFPYGVDAPLVPVIDQNYYGNRAIVNSSPTRPSASIYSLVQGVLETRLLLDGFGSNRSLWVPNLYSSYNAWLKGRKSFVKATSESFLSTTFGWEPLVRDIISLANAVIHSRDIIQQMQRDNGRMIRRKFHFDPIHTTSYSSRGTSVAFGSGAATANSIISSVITGIGGGASSASSSQKIWFSGAFTYYLKAGNGLNERLDRYAAYAQQILGVKLTPDVIWNLAPWTWLVDWNVDVSSALQVASMSEHDGLVVEYGYLMRETEMSVKDTLKATTTLGGRPIDLYRGRFLRKKERFRSTPFGFGVNPNTFTGEQWAILAALGFTKAPKTLW
jgi:hypothetical protein